MKHYGVKVGVDDSTPFLEALTRLDIKKSFPFYIRNTSRHISCKLLFLDDEQRTMLALAVPSIEFVEFINETELPHQDS